MEAYLNRRRFTRNIEPYGWLSPSMLLFIIFLVYPIIFSIILSFFEWRGYSTDIFSKFIGFQNFIKLFRDGLYWQSLKNTLILVLVVVFIQNAIALFLALVLYFGKFKYGNLIRALIFFPGVISAIIIGLVFRKFLELSGPVNTLLKSIGLDMLALPWLATKSLTIWIVSIVTTWQWVGYNMVIFYAGLQNVENNLLEAAYIDGASMNQAIFRIVIPMLKPVIFLSMILNFIGGFRIYDIIWATTRGGPVHSSEVLTTYMYYQSFQSNGPSNMGYASAISVTLTLIVIIFAAVRIKFFVKEGRI
ncbi:MAG: sugar ABC transporter permease [Actinobacteria bacterium]|nr:sugar ABC transporter permease [Actinomycetota bacterium]